MSVVTSVSAIAVAAVLAAGVPLITCSRVSAAPRAELSAPSATTVPAPAESPGPARSVPTTTSLAVTPSAGAAFQSVTISVSVSSASGAPTGRVSIQDGAARVAAGVPLVHGVATVTTNALGPGAHTLSAGFGGSLEFAPSTSAPVPVVFGATGTPGAQSVVVTIPAGSITITTPYTRGRPLDLGRADLDQSTSTYSAGARVADIVVTDTRAGNLGFTATVVASRFVSAGGGSFAGSYAGLVELAADQVQGNAMLARQVQLTDTPPAAPGLGSPRAFARYPAGFSTGTVRINGVLEIGKVPSSVRAGDYLATLTFTAV